MRLSAALLALALASACTTARPVSRPTVRPYDVSGWQQLPWGARPSTVSARFSRALREPRPGEAGNAVVHDVLEGGCPATAQLFAPRGRLERVLVRAAGPCPDLERDMAARFGEAGAARLTRYSTVLVWSFPSTRITLMRERVSHPDVQWEALVVIYESTDAAR